MRTINHLILSNQFKYNSAHSALVTDLDKIGTLNDFLAVKADNKIIVFQFLNTKRNENGDILYWHYIRTKPIREPKGLFYKMKDVIVFNIK